MQQHRNWLRPNLAEMHTPAVERSSDPADAVLAAAPRQRVALGEAVPLGALDGGAMPGLSVREREAAWPAAVAVDGTPAPDAEALMSALSCVTEVRAARSMMRKSERGVGSSGPQARSREFEFTGQGSLSVISSITGRHYRFCGCGARVAADPRDWGQLSRVPSLRLVVD